ncbi:helicase-exonuclease AddAB subunit AddA [Exiguobacterium antarcticum]|uniref:ATP-dependent helicase/nuclease subunit A n=1 Tax=Exiguobacterium antarcticum TaxID=132920 RepID=A0ABT6QZ56_9BACL|nr:helicase-exonuclease AddAB subunit AddA [Exiguobacterium antarcticum]MDI3233972.1 helicase-exonuclease AddAB subunit AddA [Exiguobacterium antarcticum]
MSVQWTDEQQQAIDARGGHILVSAAAGSGKTAVLVERLTQRVINQDDPLTADRMLVATFTNAAAKEMKTRVIEAIEAKIKLAPDDIYLKKQRQMMNRAQITTIHSFCLSILRENYYRIGLDPAFRIAEEAELLLLQDDVLEEVFESFYAAADPAFYELIDSYTSDRDDQAMLTLISNLYRFSRSLPDPEAFYDHLIAQYDQPIDPDESTLLTRLLELEWERVAPVVNRYLELSYRLRQSGYDEMAEMLMQDVAPMRQINPQTDRWTTIALAFQAVEFGRWKGVRGDEEMKLFQAERTRLVSDLKKMRELFVEKDGVDYLEDLRSQLGHVQMIVMLVRHFSTAYLEAKQQRGIVDFSDLEHFALAILEQDGEATDVARLLQERFVEVLVDEYQDTNEVQERILKLVSKSDEATGNLFMVGDVKQSIYKFRHAEPGLFLNKFKRFRLTDVGTRIDLTKNFRSRLEVLDGTNHIFRQVMDEAVGEIDYDEAAHLRLGNLGYVESNQVEPELLLVDQTDTNKEELEAQVIATRIIEMVNDENPYLVFDAKQKRFRKCEYRDIVVLVRSRGKRVQALVDVFEQYELPVYADTTGGYFQATEIQIMMALLKTIDNPLQDIPLAGVLRSPIFGLTDRDLGRIRAKSKETTFYEAAVLVAQEETPLGLRVDEALTRLQQWRTEARGKSLASLIRSLFDQTGYFEYVGCLNGGRSRQANLNALYERANQYEASGYRGLYRFLRLIHRLVERGEDFSEARSLGEDEDVVRIMTIHQSKGLEFPVTIVSQLGKQFNKQDQMQAIQLHKTYGIALDAIDPIKRLRSGTLLKEVIRREMDREMKAEEMRVLYVAMTRAKEKLILVGAIKGLEEQLSKWQDQPLDELLLPEIDRRNAKTYADWVAPAVLRKFMLDEQEQQWSLRIMTRDDIAPYQELTKMIDQLEHVRALEKIDHVGNEPFKQQIEAAFAYQYPYQVATDTAAKQTVTELKRTEQLERAAFESTYRQSTYYRTPQFLGPTLTGAERGTVLHLAMQLYEAGRTIEDQIVDWERTERISALEAGTMREAIPELTTFLSSAIGQLFEQRLATGDVYRELPFTYKIDSARFRKDWHGPSDQAVMQGIVDCLIQDGETYILLDYKSDQVFEAIDGQDQHHLLRERYATQLNLYQEALESILKITISQKLIYAFALHEVIEIH